VILQGFPVGPIEANCYIFGDEGRSEVFVIDAGDEAERILETLRLLKVRPIALVNTHGHFDHIQAVDAVRRATGAPFWIHEGEAELLRHGPARAKLLFDLDLPPSPVPDRWLTEGDTLQVGPLFLTVRHTPGHSPGGICLLGDGLAFVGDTLFAGSIGRTDLPGADVQTLLQSIARVLMPLPDDTACYPGHGPQTTIGEEKRTNQFIAPLFHGGWLRERP
jgi:hydroxyacylglutathione hydrolase